MIEDRVAQFEADIAASPVALERLLDRWTPHDLRGRGRSVMTGLGSSRYAAQIVAAQVVAQGGTAWVESAATSAPTPPAADLACIAISASGRTREVVDAAERHQGRSLVVALTNDPTSPLADRADIVIPLHAGEEAAGIASRTFRATIAAAALLSGTATVASLRPAIDALAERLANRDASHHEMVEALDGALSIDVLADASLLGLAEQAALMLREAPRLPARACDTAEWLHTGVYLALPGHRVLLFPGSAADDEVLVTAQRRGGLTSRVASTWPISSTAGPIGRAIVDSVVGESLAAALWGRASAHDKLP